LYKNTLQCTDEQHAYAYNKPGPKMKPSACILANKDIAVFLSVSIVAAAIYDLARAIFPETHRNTMGQSMRSKSPLTIRTSNCSLANQTALLTR